MNHAEELRDIYHRLNEIRLELPIYHHEERWDIVKAMSNITIAITMIEARAKAGVGV